MKKFLMILLSVAFALNFVLVVGMIGEYISPRQAFYTITSEMMNRYAKDMDPDIINRITEENGSCTPQEFLRAYTEQDPKFKKTLEKKYDITTQEDDFYDYR